MTAAPASARSRPGLPPRRHRRPAPGARVAPAGPEAAAARAGPEGPVGPAVRVAGPAAGGSASDVTGPSASFGPGTTPTTFSYNGPLYYKPPYHTGGSSVQGSIFGGKPGKNGGHGGTNTQPAPGPTKPGTTSALQAAPTSSGSQTIPPYVWALVPMALILIAAVGAVVFEREDEEATARVAAGSAKQRKPKSQVEHARPRPLGPLVLLGFATRRALGGTVRGIGRVLHISR